MGRKTFASIGKPLPGRRNIVLSRDVGFHAEGCETATCLEDALEKARETDPCPFVIGGAAIYREALPLATKLYVTEVELEVEGGDTFFPEWKPEDWRLTEANESPPLRFFGV